ncbi:MAG: cation diffusion facilitator family transporter, partial [Bacteroidetes bacterium]|nr:cation diffusion facilitator family transporter [Bacteroidota bacterium]
MAHNHGHAHGPHHTHTHGHHGQAQGAKNILIALLLNFGFTIIEIIGGLLSNSLAVISDAVHDLGDSVALGMSYYAEKRSGHKVLDQNYTFGLRRLPLISAALNGLILLGGSAWVVASAIPRLQAPQAVASDWMIGLGILGVAINGLAVLRLRGNAGINSRVVALHLLEDALGWVAVLIGAVA